MHPTQKSTPLNSEVRVERHSLLNASRSSHSAKFALKMGQKNQHLFHDWRFEDDAGTVPTPGFVLNKPEFKGTSILLARENFGCGSSREHAPWALTDFGFHVVIAPSFADIFYGNSFNNQLLPVKLSEEEVDELFRLVAAQPGISFTVDLEAQTVTAGDKVYPFELDSFRRHCMINGLDSIGLTLQHEASISQYEQNQPAFLR